MSYSFGMYERDKADKVWAYYKNQMALQNKPFIKNRDEFNWYKYEFRYVGIIISNETNMTECIALVNRRTNNGDYFVNMIMSFSPFMNMPFYNMIVHEIVKIAEEEGKKVNLTPKYKRYLYEMMPQPGELTAEEMARIDAKIPPIADNMD